MYLLTQPRGVVKSRSDEHERLRQLLEIREIDLQNRELILEERGESGVHPKAKRGDNQPVEDAATVSARAEKEAQLCDQAAILQEKERELLERDGTLAAKEYDFV